MERMEAIRARGPHGDWGQIPWKMEMGTDQRATPQRERSMEIATDQRLRHIQG